MSGICKVGYISRKIFASSEKCITLSTRQYLPLAESISYAWICAFATSFTLIHPKLLFENVGEPASTKWKSHYYVKIQYSSCLGEEWKWSILLVKNFWICVCSIIHYKPMTWSRKDNSPITWFFLKTEIRIHSQQALEGLKSCICRRSIQRYGCFSRILYST